MEPGETIHNGAVREVKEETGIDSKFIGVLGFREYPNSDKHDQGNLYFPCLLKA